MIWKPFFDVAQGRASWPHGGIGNVRISAYWSIQIFTQYGHVIRINMYYVHINISIYIYIIYIYVFSKGVACTNPVQPELLGLFWV